MSGPFVAGIAAAVLCALLTNLAFLLKHQGACSCPPVCFRSPLRSATHLLRNRVFMAGMAVAIAGFVFHAAAMSLAPLSIVKPVIAGGLVFLAVLAEKRFGCQVSSRQWIGVGLVGLGLLAMAVTVPAPHETEEASNSGLLVFEAVLLTVCLGFAIIPRSRRAKRHTALLFAAATGLLFGASDVAIKALSEMAPMEILLSPWLLMCIACAVGAFLLGARSLQLGDAVPTIATTCVTSNLSAIIGGFVVFGDPMPNNPLHLAINLGALLMIVMASMLVPAPTRQPEPGAA